MDTQDKNDAIKRGRGRPATGKGAPITLRLQPALLAALDAHIDTSGKSRPEAIREILEAHLHRT